MTDRIEEIFDQVINEDCPDPLRRFAELVRQDEREACAKVCEQTIKESEISYKETKFEKQQRLLCLKMMEISANSIAEAIRARSKHD